MGLGWIIRDNYGNVAHSGMGKYQGRYTTDEAECTALLLSLQTSLSMGYRKVVFKEDDKNIIRAITYGQINLKIHYISAIRQWILIFEAISFKNANRSCNACANTLAKKAVTASQEWCIFHNCKSFLHGTMYSDINE